MSSEPIQRVQKHVLINTNYLPPSFFKETYTLKEQQMFANLIQEGDFVMLGKNSKKQIRAKYLLHVWYDTLSDLNDPIHLVFKVESPILISDIFGSLKPSQLNKINRSLSKYFEGIEKKTKIDVEISDSQTQKPIYCWNSKKAVSNQSI
ncbi:MAG: hypothetical protein ACFHWX_07900 [Bacteroidota bacterium]